MTQFLRLVFRNSDSRPLFTFGNRRSEQLDFNFDGIEPTTRLEGRVQLASFEILSIMRTFSQKRSDG